MHSQNHIKEEIDIMEQVPFETLLGVIEWDYIAVLLITNVRFLCASF